MRRWLIALLALLAWAGMQGMAIGGISFLADFPVDSGKLQDASGLKIGAEYSAADVTAAITAMQSWLQEQGHPFVKIANPDLVPLSENSLELAFSIREILQADNCRLEFNGLRYFSAAKLRELLLLGEGETSGISTLPALMVRILDLYHDRGYLFASVKLDSLVAGEGLAAYIGITEGKPLKPEKYYFSGNKYTREQTLVKLSGLQDREVITPAALQAGEENILSKSYISGCQIEPVDPSSILIKVEEGKMTYLEGVLGFTRGNGKTELTGLVNLKFLNLWGSDRSIALNWRKLPQASQLQFAYHESGPVSFPLAGDLYLSRAEQDTTWIKSSLGAEIYSYHAKQRYGIELAGESVAAVVDTSGTIEKSSARSVGAFWRLDSRDQQFNPSRGMETDITYRLRYLNGEKNWNNALEADHTQYIGISRRWTVSLGLHLRSLADSSSADHELYRMGGYNSLRGYREDEFSGWRLGWANLELRYLVSPQARLYIFYDHGLLSQGRDSLRADLLAPGVGLKVRTRLGVLSIEYALGLRENGFASLASGMVHAGLDASF
jgi:outer membrane protein assembly factor BamA